MTARLRLTAAFLALFVGLGAGLLAMNYRIMAGQLPVISGVVVSDLAGQLTTISGVSNSEAGFGTVSTALPATSQGSVDVPTEPSSPAGATIEVLTQRAAMAASEQFRAATLQELLRSSVVTLLLMAVFAALLTYWVAGRVLRPLHRITETARGLDERHLAGRIRLAGPRDELRDLADTLDSMLDRLQASFATERRLVANTSHELRTPIANQRTVLEVALADPDASAETLRDVCQSVLTQTRRQELLVSSMLGLARAQHATPQLESVRLDRVVEHALGLLDVSGLTVTSRCSPVAVSADPLLADVAVTNLLANAVTHNGPPGWMKVALAATPEGGELRISNSAPTVDPRSLDALREPFRRGGASRTRSGHGAGLGLSIVDTIVDLHGWTMTLSAEAEGTFSVLVRFPVQESLEGAIPATSGSKSRAHESTAPEEAEVVQ